MRNILKTWMRSGASLALALALSPGLSPAAAETADDPVRVLLYDYNASNIYNGPRKALRSVLKQKAGENGFFLTMTREAKGLSYADLKTYDVLILAHGDGGELREPAKRSDVERFVREGGGLIALHSTGGYRSSFKFLTDALGARYAHGYNVAAPARLYADSQSLENPGLGRIYQGLPAEVTLREKWLNFSNNPRDTAGVQVLFSVDESTYKYGRMGGDHPIVWTRAVGKGRVVYSALGEARDAYTQQESFGARLLQNLIAYAAHNESGDLRKGQAPGKVSMGLSVAGRRVALSVGNGVHKLRVLDFQGKTLFSREYSGPGTFQTDPLDAKGTFSAILSGPEGSLQRRITLR